MSIITMFSVTTVEILAITIRCNSKIKGIIHNEVENKINKFLDDTVLSVIADESLYSEIMTPPISGCFFSIVNLLFMTV